MNSVMCEHEYEIEGEVLAVNFDENDLAEVFAKRVWLCYDCQQVTQDSVEGDNDVQRS